MGVRVDQLIAETSVRKIGPLRDIEDFVGRRLVNLTASGGPELSKNSEQRTLTTPIRSSDHEMHAGLDLKVHFGDQAVSVRRINWHIDKFDPV